MQQAKPQAKNSMISALEHSLSWGNNETLEKKTPSLFRSSNVAFCNRSGLVVGDAPCIWDSRINEDKKVPKQ
jgi:hypothetical protein